MNTDGTRIVIGFVENLVPSRMMLVRTVVGLMPRLGAVLGGVYAAFQGSNGRHRHAHS